MKGADKAANSMAHFQSVMRIAPMTMSLRQ
jgi:hypothetical protein